MWHLMKSELDRFWKVGLIAALVHMGFWQVVLQSDKLSAFNADEAWAALAIAFVAAAAFGLYQIGSLKKPGTWTFLIHRPLPEWQIFVGLMAAGWIWLTGVVAAPTFLSVFYADKVSPDWVDGRHYGLPFMLLGVAWFIYCVALLSRLSPSRLAFLAVVLMPFFVTTKAVGWWAGAVLLIALVVVVWLTLAHFKPDLSRPPRSAAVAVVMAALITYGVASLLSGVNLTIYSFGVAFVEKGAMGPVKHSWNDYFPTHSIDNMGYRNTREVFELGLARVDNDRGQALLPQVALVETAEVAPMYSRYPRRHGPMYNHDPAVMVDAEAEVTWTFSHQEMLFRGVHRRTEQEMGWLGPEGFVETAGEPRFSSVPMGGAHNFLFTSDAVWELDFLTRRITRRFEVPVDEMVTGGPVALGSVRMVLTDAALYLFDSRQWRLKWQALVPVARVELPARIGRLIRVQAAELLDGYLISMLISDQGGQGDDTAFQWLGEVSIDGQVSPLARLELSQGVPDEVRFRGIGQSPISFVFHELMTRLTSRPADRWRSGDGFGFFLTPRAWRFMAICCFLAAALAWLLASRRGLGRSARRLWTLWCLVSGPAGWLAMLFLTEAREARRPSVSEGLGRVQALGATTAFWSPRP